MIKRLIGVLAAASVALLMVLMTPAPAQAEDCDALAQAVIHHAQAVMLLGESVSQDAHRLDQHIEQGAVDLIPSDLATLAFDQERLDHAQSNYDAASDALHAAHCY
jgi:hypothetical protein